jgi:SEC-C motif domain protein
MTLVQADDCPCGSTHRYGDCCAPWHAQAEPAAPTPQALMRSRYSAFVLDLRPYLLATWHPSTRPAKLEAPPPDLKWLGLQVRAAPPPRGDEAEVEFVARSKQAGRAFRLHERSRFVREGGRWFYLDGQVLNQGRGTVRPSSATRPTPMSDFSSLPTAVGHMIGLAALGSCIGIGIMASKFLESSARQPEMMEPMQSKVFLLAGLLDGAFIISTAIGLWFALANPFK